jgi:hypothetical protein
LFEASPQLDALDDRLKSLNRALHTFLHMPSLPPIDMNSRSILRALPSSHVRSAAPLSSGIRSLR